MSNLVSDYMSTEFLTFVSPTSLLEAIEQMLQNGKEMGIVLERNKRIVGVITEVDIIRERNNPDFHSLKVGDMVAIIPVISLAPDDSIENAAHIFESYHNIDQIVVEKHGTVVGVLYKSHILTWMLKSKKGN